MKRLLALLVLIGCGTGQGAEAAPPKIAGASISDNRMRVDVAFDGGVAEADVATSTFWFVLLATKRDITRRDVTSVIITGCSNDTTSRQSGPCPAGDTVSTVALVLTMAAPLDLTAIQVIYRGPLGAAAENFKIAGATGSIVAGAKKDDADISVSGSYARTAAGDQKYNVDSFAGFMRQFGFSQFAGAYAQAKSQDAASIDPQAFLVYGAWRYLLGSGEFTGPFQGAIVNGLTGWEFSNKAEQKNFTSSPSVIVPFRLTRGVLGLIQPGFTTPNGTLHVGVEFVKPLASKLDEKSWRYRGLFGATLTAGLQSEKPAFYGIAFKGLYEVRLLSDDEPFIDPRHAPVNPETGKKEDPPLEFGEQPRHHAEASANYLFAEWAGVEFKYEYGGLPPAFVLADHTFTISVALTLKQTSYARSTILRP